MYNTNSVLVESRGRQANPLHVRHLDPFLPGPLGVFPLHRLESVKDGFAGNLQEEAVIHQSIKH